MKFSCPACGKTLNVRDEYAGKKARCPGCKEVLTVPHSPEAADAATEQAVSETSTCPNCGASLAEGAVFCVSCGYDLRTGKLLETVTGGGSEGDDDEGSGEE